jgi:hypothetical protein
MSVNIVAMLNQLAEFHSQKDSIDAQKRELLDDVKVPSEVNLILSRAKNDALELDYELDGLTAQVRLEINNRLATVVIPDEVKELIAKINSERNNLVQELNTTIQRMISDCRSKQSAINDNAMRNVQETLAAVDQRKREIEAEFHGKIGAVDDNIKALEAEIKAATKVEGKTVKGKYFSAIYVKGRTSWDTEGLNVYADQHPGVVKYRTVGDPSITLRKV